MYYIIKNAVWKLYDDEKLLIDKKITNLFLKNNIIEYQEESFKNIIFLEKEIYIRENFDYRFEFDFKNNKFFCKIKKYNEELNGEMIVSNFNNSIKNDKLLILEYSIEENNLKKLIVQLL